MTELCKGFSGILSARIDIEALYFAQGPHIDELFNDTKREARIKFNGRLAERSPHQVGTEPLKRFNMHSVVWVEYEPR